jgi:hypothetical protein
MHFPRLSSSDSFNTPTRETSPRSSQSYIKGKTIPFVWTANTAGDALHASDLPTYSALVLLSSSSVFFDDHVVHRSPIHPPRGPGEDVGYYHVPGGDGDIPQSVSSPIVVCVI